MQKQRNRSQLKDQESSPKDETDISSIPDSEFKKEIMKILKELRKVIDRNADYCKKELETIKEVPIKIRKLICQDKS